MTQEIDRGDSPRHILFSPEGVHLDLPIGGPALRMFAYVFDFVLILILILLLAIALFTLLPLGAMVDRWWNSFFHQPGAASGHVESFGNAVGVIFAIFLLAQFIIETGYFIFWEMMTNGRSPGKALAGLRVVCRDGLPINFRSSMIRNVMRIVDILPSNYLVGLISIIVSRSGERLGDHAAGTLVVRLDRPEAAPDLGISAELPALPFTRQQLSLIGPRELQLVRGTLRRIGRLGDQRGQQLLAEVAESMRIRMGLEEIPSADRVEFLRNLVRTAERYSIQRAG